MAREIDQDLAFLCNNIERLNQKWNITDGPVKSRRPVVGWLLTILKRCIRKTVYWLIRPYWDQQIEFNRILAATAADIYRIQCRLLQLNEQNDAARPEDIPLRVSGPRIVQLVSSLNFGDAVGNEVIAFKRALQENGYITEIYANYIQDKIPPEMARFYKDMPPLQADDIVIYHFASECSISNDIRNFPCRVILRYHNVTPPEFFHGFDSNAEKATTKGLLQVKKLIPYIDYCLPVSEFNRQDLIKMGYACPMKVLPILIRFEDYEQEPDAGVIQKYSDGVTNFLFVGRIAPNKKLEDVISVFAYYKEHYDEQARLFLVGSFQETDLYYQYLQNHIKKLNIHDVIFPGHISFQAILAYYKIADLFLCMSEHEGFCVPVVEAMYFSVPIVAYDSSAIPDTLGHAGVLVKSKDPREIAPYIQENLHRTQFKKQQAERIHSLNKKVIEKNLMEWIHQIYEAKIKV